MCVDGHIVLHQLLHALVTLLHSPDVPVAPVEKKPAKVFFVHPTLGLPPVGGLHPSLLHGLLHPPAQVDARLARLAQSVQQACIVSHAGNGLLLVLGIKDEFLLPLA